ncbi:MAG: MBL fold metallo-hydrolase [Nitrospirae bacterium]|nr:MBL fold metallo-hydrolase [Candidatus Troglogloeales bacterium]
MNKIILLLLFVFLLGCKTKDDVAATQFLEIHVINVQQGDATLIIGPDGTTLLVDGGDTGKGKKDVVDYLKGLGIEKSIDHMVNTHRHADHLGGLDEVINAGFDVRKGIWANGSDSVDTDANRDFLAAAMSTTAGSVKTISPGQIIGLGGGAKATVVAASGNILGTTTPFTLTDEDENDKSVALLIQYGRFDYIMSGDLGGGADDTVCTGRTTKQKNMESILVKALTEGVKPLLTSTGVDAMMVPHHGSESSTNQDYMNGMSPRVAIISVGDGQGSLFHHPRKDIVNVLTKKVACITAEPSLVLQTDEGEGDPMVTDTSQEGFVSGDVVIKTNGVSTFQVSGSGRVREGSPDERVSAGINPPRSFPLD